MEHEHHHFGEIIMEHGRVNAVKLDFFLERMLKEGWSTQRLRQQIQGLRNSELSKMRASLRQYIEKFRGQDDISPNFFTSGVHLTLQENMTRIGNSVRRMFGSVTALFSSREQSQPTKINVEQLEAEVEAEVERRMKKAFN